jgi:hypothetical protein
MFENRGLIGIFCLKLENFYVREKNNGRREETTE